jgi:hypothetical protein
MPAAATAGEGVPPRITTGFNVADSAAAEIGVGVPAADAASPAFAAPKDSGTASAYPPADFSPDRNAANDKNQFSSPATDASASGFFPRGRTRCQFCNPRATPLQPEPSGKNFVISVSSRERGDTPEKIDRREGGRDRAGLVAAVSMSGDRTRSRYCAAVPTGRSRQGACPFECSCISTRHPAATAGSSSQWLPRPWHLPASRKAIGWLQIKYRI